MTILIIANIAAWSALFVYMVIRGAWAAALHRSPRHGDPMRVGVAAVAFTFVGFFIRRLVGPDSEIAFMALSMLSLVVACVVASLARSYGRGPLL